MSAIRDTRGDLTERLRELTDHLATLVGAQLKLTRLELQGDARAIGHRLGRVALVAPVLLVGYACVAAAVVVALAHLVGLVASLLLVGVVQLAAGGWACVHATRALARVRVLDRSRDELRTSVERVAAAAKPETDG